MADNVTFAVEWRDDLVTGAWSNAGVTEQILTNNGIVQTITASVAAGFPTRFLHLKVTKPCAFSLLPNRACCKRRAFIWVG